MKKALCWFVNIAKFIISFRASTLSFVGLKRPVIK